MLSLSLFLVSFCSAAGMAVAKYMCDNNILENVRARGEQLEAGLQQVASKYPKLLGDVRGWGLLRGIEVIDDNVPPGKIVAAAMELGLLLVSAGKNVVRFVPPLIISEAEIKQALSMFEAAVAKVAADEGLVSP
jgi:acetylornithine/N-succinyldiaminopimelate aminotransferase